MAREEVVALEEQGWEAFSSGGEVPRGFYERLVDSGWGEHGGDQLTLR